MRARQVERRAGALEGVLELGLVGDVLAQALLPIAAQADDRRPARPARGDLDLEAVERVGLDLEPEGCELLVQRYAS